MFLSSIVVFDKHFMILIFLELSFLLYNESFLFIILFVSFPIDILLYLLFNIFSGIFISFLKVFLVEGVSLDKLTKLFIPNWSNI